jgi:hypothetical protein
MKLITLETRLETRVVEKEEVSEWSTIRNHMTVLHIGKYHASITGNLGKTATVMFDDKVIAKLQYSDTTSLSTFHRMEKWAEEVITAHHEHMQEEVEE